MTNIVRAAGIFGFNHLVQKLGGDPLALLKDVGLDNQVFEDPDLYISYRAVIKAFEQAAAKLNVSDFALQLLDYQDDNLLGALSLASQSADSIYGALQIAATHFDFHTPGAKVSIEENTAGEHTVQFHLLLENSPPHIQVAEHAIGLIHKSTKLHMNSDAHPKAIYFRHKAKSPAHIYQKHFGINPQFSAPFDGVVFESNILHKKVDRNNPWLMEAIDNFFVHHTPKTHLPLEEQVKETLQKLMRISKPSLHDIARALMIEPRTLQRRLKNSGNSFEEIRDGIRQELASSYLAQQYIPLSQIAFLLGYADQTVFTRSCHRWFGQTPLERRLMILSQ
ncbi:MAG: AraC family transcriptional regulator [Parvibaculaceae bacterium]|nr:AraC family transcriptional regulator [Parvibaculaceae bacterium]